MLPNTLRVRLLGVVDLQLNGRPLPPLDSARAESLAELQANSSARSLSPGVKSARSNGGSRKRSRNALFVRVVPGR